MIRNKLIFIYQFTAHLGGSFNLTLLCVSGSPIVPRAHLSPVSHTILELIKL